MIEALFMPCVTVDSEGGIDVDWFQSFINISIDGEVDETPDDDHGLAAVLDARLDRIRQILDYADPARYDVPIEELVELIRPFFASVYLADVAAG